MKAAAFLAEVPAGGPPALKRRHGTPILPNIDGIGVAMEPGPKPRVQTTPAMTGKVD